MESVVTAWWSSVLPCIADYLVQNSKLSNRPGVLIPDGTPKVDEAVEDADEAL